MATNCGMMFTTNLDLFSERPAEMAVEASRDEIIAAAVPLPSNNHSIPLQFKIPASRECYTDLANTILEMQCKLTFDDGTALSAADDVGAVNNFLNSSIAGVSVCMNGTPVVTNHCIHPWTAYLDAVTRFPTAAAQSYMASAGLRSDKPTSILSDAVKARVEEFYANATVTYVGPIMTPLFRTRRWLIPMVDVGLTLFRSKPDFIFMYEPPDESPIATETTATTTAKVAVKKSLVLIIEKASLWVPRKRLTEAAARCIETRLLKNPAIIPTEEIMLRTLIVPKDTYSVDAAILDGAIIPKRIEIFQVQQRAANGDLRSNPLHLESYGLKTLALERDGQPMDCYDMDTARPYLQQFRIQSDCLINEPGNATFNEKDWLSGLCVLKFGTNQHPLEAPWRIKPTTGSIRLRAQWDVGKKRTDTIVVMILLIYDKTITIDHERRVTFS